MSNYPVGAAVLAQLFSRFSDSVSGWNATFNALAPFYGVPADMAIDFVGAQGRSKNFVKANIRPDDWISTSSFEFPLLALFIKQSRNENLQKFMQFSGTVTAGIMVLLSFENARVVIDFDSIASCVEETIYTVMNRARISSPGDQDWNNLLDGVGDVVYNGDVDVIRMPLARGDEMWGLPISASAEFQVDQKGQWA